jgi:capsular polysaccharide biosynthesis protein
MKMRMLLGAAALVAVVVTMVSLLQMPTFEASAQVWVDQEGGDQQNNLGGSGEEIKTLPPGRHRGLQALTQTIVVYIDTPLVAREAIRRLELEVSPGELLHNLTIEQVESSQFIRLTCTDTDAERAARVVNTVGRVSSERVSNTSGANSMTAALYDKASVPEAPARPKPWRNGLIALVVGLALSAALIEARRRVRLNEERER